MTARVGICLLFSLYNNWTDYKEGRVHNRAALLVALLGLAWNGAADGWRGVGASVVGCAVMLVLFPLFALRMLGAGDVKALMAIGAVLGVPIAGTVLLYSLLGAGMAAVCTLFFRKNGRARLRRLWTYFKSCCFLGRVLPYAATVGEGDGGFRFTFGITLGLLILMLETLSKSNGIKSSR